MGGFPHVGKLPDPGVDFESESLEADLEKLMEVGLDSSQGPSLDAPQHGATEEEDAEAQKFWEEGLQGNAIGSQSQPGAGSSHVGTPQASGKTNDSQQFERDLERIMDEGLTQTQERVEDFIETLP